MKHCSFTVVSKHTCNHGDVRLLGGQSKYEGRVEFCYSGSWTSVCPIGWDYREAAVICRQSGFHSIGKLTFNNCSRQLSNHIQVQLLRVHLVKVLILITHRISHALAMKIAF